MTQKTVLIAPDKFKGTLTALEAAAAMQAAVHRIWPTASIIRLGLADGGDGTCTAALAAGGTEHSTTVTGPLGRPVPAAWVRLGETAVLEMANASGLRHVEPTPENALRASTFGTGELIRAALDDGATRIVIGLGGSATTDGGAGAVQALGVKILDANHNPIPEGGAGLGTARSIDLTGMDPRLSQMEIVMACDVTNPLCGPNGAAHVYAAQKGANPGARIALDAALAYWAHLLRSISGVDVSKLPRAGAAGGFPAAFMALTNATMQPGADLVFDLINVDEALAAADLVLTGEGSLDDQSIQGKAPIALAQRARTSGIDAIAIAGKLELDQATLAPHGIVVAESAAQHAPSLQDAMRNPRHYLEKATESALHQYERIRQ
ncbi:glycerate kinase [Arthrobacter mobilis]|uniref:Glycerate kinase n=1 Tax=Arthrobacter mobilis TaxID=2724944 RepID=A0A7X6HGE6_9MICC|nr:glycerate kinase [Arthrobacter mobilis]NKX55551.1 glycerate kinase [Arthrobacter mobilis]